MTYGGGQSCALDIVTDAQKVNHPLHLWSTQYLQKVKNRYDDILWEKGHGYCDGIGKKCECSMDSKVDCSILKDIMCA
jgi:uncharacterized protein (DUF779 family)